MTITYQLSGKKHIAEVTACEMVDYDPDYAQPYYLWTLRFNTPVTLFDGSLMYQTFIRKFTDARKNTTFFSQGKSPKTPYERPTTK